MFYYLVAALVVLLIVAALVGIWQNRRDGTTALESAMLAVFAAVLVLIVVYL